MRALHDRRIRYLRNEHSFWQTKSLNRGIRESRSDWIVRADGDDLIHSLRLELTAAAIRAGGKNRARLFFFDYDVTDAERRLLGLVTDGDLRKAILCGVALAEPVSEAMNITADQRARAVEFLAHLN